jgi:hypothetical protein
MHDPSIITFSVRERKPSTLKWTQWRPFVQASIKRTAFRDKKKQEGADRKKSSQNPAG